MGKALFTLLKRGDILDDEDEKNVLSGALVEQLLLITESLVKHGKHEHFPLCLIYLSLLVGLQMSSQTN